MYILILAKIPWGLQAQRPSNHSCLSLSLSVTQVLFPSLFSTDFTISSIFFFNFIYLIFIFNFNCFSENSRLGLDVQFPLVLCNGQLNSFHFLAVSQLPNGISKKFSCLVLWKLALLEFELELGLLSKKRGGRRKGDFSVEIARGIVTGKIR